QTFSLGGSNAGSSGNLTCSKGYLIQGINVYPTSTWVSAMKTRCDKAWDTLTSDSIGGTWGGTANSATIIACPEGSYMSGLKTWRNATSTTSNRYIRRMAMNCRGGN
ncbi:MAG: hypothetical protein ACTHOH_19185, partial [Lysobacteraceae bacterium]